MWRGGDFCHGHRTHAQGPRTGGGPTPHGHAYGRRTLRTQGKVVCPGYHTVKGRYMRSNPDKTIHNNLSERFVR